MNFLKKLFGKKEESIPEPPQKEPDNAKLKFYLTNYGQHPTQENYEIAFNELLHGNTKLLMPLAPNAPDPVAGDDHTTLGLGSVYDLDGLLVLGAFTDEESLYAWTKTPTRYVALRTGDIVTMCKQNNVSRIVINNDQPTMFVLERDRSHVAAEEMTEATKVSIGIPALPLPADFIESLRCNFKRVQSISEAYVFFMDKNGEKSHVIGTVLLTESENARMAVSDAISNAIEGRKFDYPVDCLVITDSWRETLQKFNVRFYTKE